MDGLNTYIEFTWFFSDLSKSSILSYGAVTYWFMNKLVLSNLACFDTRLISNGSFSACMAANTYGMACVISELVRNGL